MLDSLYHMTINIEIAFLALKRQKYRYTYGVLLWLPLQKVIMVIKYVSH